MFKTKREENALQSCDDGAIETNKRSNEMMIQAAAKLTESNAFATFTMSTQQDRNRKPYYMLYVVTQLIGITTVVLTCVWILCWKGGFAWRAQTSQYFNWHIIINLLGVIYLPANGILIFRMLNGIKQENIKLLHTCFGPLTMLCIICSTWIAVDTCNLQPCPQWYTLHSWLAIIYIGCFVIQWIFGLVTFYSFNSVENFISNKKKFLRLHNLSGITIFLLSILVALLGYFEEYIYQIKDYTELSFQGVMMNIVGILLTLFAFLTVYLTTCIKM